MILFLKLTLWPASFIFYLAFFVCCWALTQPISNAQRDRTTTRWFIWLALSIISTAGLIAIYFS